MIKRLCIIVSLMLAAPTAFAQTAPNIKDGNIPSGAQWRSYFADKQDVLGYAPVNKAGDTMSGRLVTTPSTTTRTGFNIPCGTAPTSPNNGDIWCITATGYFFRVNGATVGPIAAPNGTPVLTSCGTSPTITGNDAGGTVTMGSGSPTGCTITFGIPYPAVPACIVTWQANLASMGYTKTTDAITITQTATSSDVIDFICTGR